MRSKKILTIIAALFAAQAAVAQDAPQPTPPVPVEAPAPVPEAVPAAPTVAVPATPPPISEWKEPAPAPDPATDQANLLYLDLSNGGRVTIQLRPDVAPGHIERIKTLVGRGFYNNVVFHRVIDGFMAQTGDPKGTGEGGSDLPDLKAEFNLLPHLRGTVSMARTSEENSANSQFFIMFMPRKSLDRKYTGFGRVISGMEFVDAIERGEHPANPTRILRASMATDGVPAPAPQAAPVPQPEEPAPTPQ